MDGIDPETLLALQDNRLAIPYVVNESWQQHRPLLLFAIDEEKSQNCDLHKVRIMLDEGFTGKFAAQIEPQVTMSNDRGIFVKGLLAEPIYPPRRGINKMSSPCPVSIVDQTCRGLHVDSKNIEGPSGKLSKILGLSQVNDNVNLIGQTIGRPITCKINDMGSDPGIHPVTRVTDNRMDIMIQAERISDFLAQQPGRPGDQNRVTPHKIFH